MRDRSMLGAQPAAHPHGDGAGRRHAGACSTRSSGSVWVAGELSGVRQQRRTGHLYFTLKDDAAQLVGRDVLARGADAAVRARGRPRRRRARAARALPAARRAPARRRAHGAARARRAAPGLRAAEGAARRRGAVRRRAQAAAAAIAAHDRHRHGAAPAPRSTTCCTTLRRRWPAARVVVRPVRVQGAGAARDIAAGIADLNRLRGRRRAHRRSRRRLARGPVGVQRGGRRARHRRVARAGGVAASVTRSTSPSPTLVADRARRHADGRRGARRCPSASELRGAGRGAVATRCAARTRRAACAARASG